MSELTKQQLAVENSTSFPNNNTGFITPTLLRTFNGNIIDSMVDEVTYNADSASWTSDITQLEQFSASLNTNFVTPTQLSASSSTLQNNINTKLNTSSFNAYTASQSGVATGSLLLTASAVSNVITFTKGDGSTFPVTVGSVIDSSSLVSTSSFNAYTQSAASGVSASINAATSSLSASLSTGISASIAGVSASLTLTDNSKLNTGSFNTYTQSIASQIAGIGQSLAGKLNTSSLSVTQNITGSVIISGSSTGAGGETLTLIGGVNPLTDLALHVLSGSVEITTPQGNGAHFYSNAPITSSNLRINGTAVIKDLFVSGTWGGTGSGSLFVENSITASVISASTIIANSASFQYVQTVFETASIIYSSGSNQFGDASNDTQTLFGRVDVKTGPLVVTGSTFVSGNITLAQGFDLVTHHVQAAGANGVEIQNNSGNTAILVGAGGSLGSTFYGQINTTAISSSGNITGNLIGTASYANKALTASFAENVTPTDVSMFVSQSVFNSYTASASSNVSASINSATGSSIVTASISGDTITFTKGNGSTFPIVVPTGSGGGSGSIETGSFATTGSNIFIGNQTITGSVILSSSADIELTVIGNSIISGNLLVTGSNINLEVDPPALSVGVTNVKTILDATASGVVTAEDIYRTGAGPTGDLSGVRLQTLSGSDTTGDTLLSRISTGVNRHTSTAMTGSVVNTIINSTWATGSAGTRVSYASNVIVNAQSASSTLTLNAGNASANYGGGTASLLAGRVNIGTTSATITSTGSFTHLGTFVTSQGITANNGGITATSGSINGEFRVNGSINITGSNPTIQSGSLSGSLVSTLTDIYPSTPQGNFIVTIDSASMATLISGGQTNANTLYFVI